MQGEEEITKRETLRIGVLKEIKNNQRSENQWERSRREDEMVEGLSRGGSTHRMASICKFQGTKTKEELLMSA